MSRLHLAMNLRRDLNRLFKVTNAGIIRQQARYQNAFLNRFSVINGSARVPGTLQKTTGTCFYCDIKSRSISSGFSFSQQQQNIQRQQPNESSKSEEATKVLPKENMFTIPNVLCVMRIGMTPFIANMVIQSQFVPAIGLLVVAGVTDLLDGWIARVVPGQSTVMGTFLDPLADKILVGTLFLSLTYVNLIPVPLTALIVGRDVILIAAGFYIRYQSLDPPKTFTRYFNVTLPTAQLAPAFISKVNTGLQLCVLGATFASTVISSVDLHPYLPFLWYTTAATTIASAVYYCFAKDTVKMLRQTSAKMKKAKEKNS